MLRLAVLGASVSAQSVHHSTGAVTGYTEVLCRDHLADIGASTLRRFTYPGNRLSDGGLAKLAELLEWRPDVCLFEPLIEDVSRGTRATEEEIAFVYASLVDAGIAPITLMLPVPSQRHPRANPEYERFHRFCRRHYLPVIEVDLTDEGPIEGRFVSVHTTHAGARIYVRQILAGMARIGDPRRVLPGLRDLPRAPDLPVRVTPVEAAWSPERREMRLGLRATGGRTTRARLVQHQKIGPASPLLDVVLLDHGREAQRQTVSVWDPYCHYPRESYVTLATFALEPGILYDLSITQSPQAPNHARARHQPAAPWPDDAARGLAPLSAAFLVSDGDLEETPPR
ncbi:hypothetical protein [Pseudogemmobacter sonorensis]|uniref:hypothetical protein n=1 Tax=Pseudogemmobacter sonorensis TaxID=2989681 RepID=UPI00368142B7